MPKELYEKHIKELQSQVNQLVTSSSALKEVDTATINKNIQALKNEQRQMEQINKNVLRILEKEKKNWFRAFSPSHIHTSPFIDV
jgi:hypothetical protein